MSENEIAALRALLTSRPRPTSVAERRERLDALGSAYPTAEDIRLEPVSAGGVPAEWSLAPGADAARVLLYLHGGGFSVGSIASHRALVTETGRAAQTRTLAIEYRRTPEHPFPAALDDALQTYQWLLEQGLQPGRIAIGGDSAGGGLTLALMVSLRERKLPLPACGWCISPWIDMEARGESYATKAAIDPMISKEYILELAGWYLNGVAPRTPLAAPLYADLIGLPPLLIQVGSDETLFDEFGTARREGRRGGRSRHARSLAAHDPRMATVLSATYGRTPSHCQGRRVHPGCHRLGGRPAKTVKILCFEIPIGRCGLWRVVSPLCGTGEWRRCLGLAGADRLRRSRKKCEGGRDVAISHNHACFDSRTGIAGRGTADVRPGRKASGRG